MLDNLFQFTQKISDAHSAATATMKLKIISGMAGAAMVALFVVGCADYRLSSYHRANNLFKYLYSDHANHVDTPAIPVLSLPLKVGVAFVPVDRQGNGNEYLPKRRKPSS
jgi:hypothetical protein